MVRLARLALSGLHQISCGRPDIEQTDPLCCGHLRGMLAVAAEVRSSRSSGRHRSRSRKALPSLLKMLAEQPPPPPSASGAKTRGMEQAKKRRARASGRKSSAWQRRGGGPHIDIPHSQSNGPGARALDLTLQLIPSSPSIRLRLVLVSSGPSHSLFPPGPSTLSLPLLREHFAAPVVRGVRFGSRRMRWRDNR